MKCKCGKFMKLCFFGYWSCECGEKIKQPKADNDVCLAYSPHECGVDKQKEYGDLSFDSDGDIRSIGSELIFDPRLSNDDIERFTNYFALSVCKLESKKNRKKLHWLKCLTDDLFLKCLEENTELTEAYNHMCEEYSKDAIIDELKDRINTALLLWDKIESYDKKY